jgi:TonB family protein
MSSKKRPGFAGRFTVSLVVSVFLHGLALLAADLFGNPVFPEGKGLVLEPVRLAVVIQEPAVAVSRGAGPRVPAKAEEIPATPPNSIEIEKSLDTRKAYMTAETAREREIEAETGVVIETAAEAVTATATEAVITEAVTERVTETITETIVDTVVTETVTEAVTETIAPAVTGAATKAMTEEATGVEDAAVTAGPGGNGDVVEPYGTGVITRPVAVNRTPPVYPRAAQENNWEGSVLLDAVILPDGTVGDLRVERSSGYGLLDDAALAAVKDWRYRPALKDNAPVACRIKIRIQFKLEE